jgi:hypothetical protein
MDDEVQAPIGVNSQRRLEKCSYLPQPKGSRCCLLHPDAAAQIYRRYRARSRLRLSRPHLLEYVIVEVNRVSSHGSGGAVGPSR